MHARALISIRGDICVFSSQTVGIRNTILVERRAASLGGEEIGWLFCVKNWWLCLLREGGRRNNYQTDCFPRWAPLGLYNSLEVSCYLASSYTHWLWHPRLHPHPGPPCDKFTYGAHCGFHNYKSGREEEVCLSNTTSLPSDQIL